MPTTSLCPPNAILFVFDPTNTEVVVPAYVDRELVASNETCVSVGTQPDVDGPTEVSLTVGGGTSNDLVRVFSGAIKTPGGRVAIVTSDFQRVLELTVPIGSVEVSIWSDDDRSPARITVNVT